MVELKHLQFQCLLPRDRIIFKIAFAFVDNQLLDTLELSSVRNIRCWATETVAHLINALLSSYWLIFVKAEQHKSNSLNLQLPNPHSKKLLHRAGICSRSARFYIFLFFPVNSFTNCLIVYNSFCSLATDIGQEIANNSLYLMRSRNNDGQEHPTMQLPALDAPSLENPVMYTPSEESVRDMIGLTVFKPDDSSDK